MQIHQTLNDFYLSILNYAGLEYKDGVIKNINEKLGEFSIDDKNITLPYHDNLKNPNNRTIFHPLNENYIKPETSIFNLYKKRLTVEINLKLVQIFTTLTHIACSVELQNKITDPTLLEFISEIKDIDMVFIENLVKVIKYSKETNDEGFIIDIFLKKNGEIKDIPYVAIGKIQFTLYEEVKKVLESNNKEYRIYGCKVRKKDINALYSLHKLLFPDIDDDNYQEGTDNKVFRYLDILLRTSYLITSRINEIATMLKTLKDKTLDIDEIECDHHWSDLLEELYTLTSVIRLIPNQTDIRHSDNIQRVKADENKIVDNTPQEQNLLHSGNNAFINQIPQQPVQNPMQVLQQPMQQIAYPTTVQQPQITDPLSVLRNMSNGNYNPNLIQQQMIQPQMYPVMSPGIQQPMQQPMPNWMREEIMKSQQPMYPNMNTAMQQPMYPNMMMNPNMNMMAGQPMQPMQNYNVLNPNLIGRTSAVF